MHGNNFIEIEGKGRGTKYKISFSYSIIKPIDSNKYFEKEIDEREIKQEFDLELIPNIIGNIELFSQDELERLNDIQAVYINKTKNLSDSQYQKELERLAHIMDQ